LCITRCAEKPGNALSSGPRPTWIADTDGVGGIITDYPGSSWHGEIAVADPSAAIVRAICKQATNGRVKMTKD
jgi:hypothetical protein